MNNLNGSQLIKKSILGMPCLKIDKVEAVSLKKSSNSWFFVNIWNLSKFLKIEVLQITDKLKFEPENSFA